MSEIDILWFIFNKPHLCFCRTGSLFNGKILYLDKYKACDFKVTGKPIVIKTKRKNETGKRKEGAYFHFRILWMQSIYVAKNVKRKKSVQRRSTYLHCIRGWADSQNLCSSHRGCQQQHPFRIFIILPWQGPSAANNGIRFIFIILQCPLDLLGNISLDVRKWAVLMISL